MKILNIKQNREADAFTIENEPIQSEALMERAATNCFRKIISRYGRNAPYIIFCGSGNNGGDGLVIARLMAQKNISVRIFLISTGKQSPDFSLNLSRLQKIRNISIAEIADEQTLPEIPKNCFVVDAIFGTGLNRPAEGLVAALIQHINRSGNQVLSVDIPSGLPGDILPIEGEIIRAHHTYTFELPKPSFFFASTHKYTGEWEVIPIGIHPGYAAQAVTNLFMTTHEDCRTLYRPRPKHAHKGSFGHALLIAGSYGQTGAAVLAAKACLRSGAGLLTVHLPESSREIMQIAVPEAMVSTDANPDECSSFPPLSKFRAVGVGPGLGISRNSGDMLRMLIQECAAPMVFDADALNILSENKTWIPFLTQGSILTPHPAEFDRLAGKSVTDIERFERLKDFAAKHRLVVVLKGAYSCIASPQGNCYFNSSGNPGMATAGSGDVLTGIITGLLAQGYPQTEAAILGVYLHGLAGDLAARKNGYEALLSSDITAFLGKAFRKLY